MAERLNQEEVAALRLRAGHQHDEYVADSTWHSLYARGYLRHCAAGALLSDKTKRALALAEKELASSSPASVPPSHRGGRT
jgi:hypothetical protein